MRVEVRGNRVEGLGPGAKLADAKRPPNFRGKSRASPQLKKCPINRRFLL